MAETATPSTAGPQLVRYLLVGAWNTVFGYGCYAALTYLLQPRLRYGYLLAAALSYFLSVTVAYFGYRWFVFQTKGPFLWELLRCFVVYSGAVVSNLVLLPIFVYGVRHFTRWYSQAPYIAGALTVAVITPFSFLGHRTFTFGASRTPQRGAE